MIAIRLILLRHLTPPIIPNGATSSNRFATDIVITTIIDGVCVGCGGSGVAVGLYSPYLGISLTVSFSTSIASRYDLEQL